MSVICDIQFPGIIAPQGEVTVTLSRGVQPSRFTFRTGYQPGFAANVGDVVGYQDGEVKFRFVGCAVVGIAVSSAASFEGTVTVEDRRWKWWKGGGVVSAHYNIRRTDQTIKDGTLKTEREIISQLLTFLGESGFDVSNVPETDKPPEVKWDAVRPAEVLGSLLSTLGLQIVLRLDNTFAVYPDGFSTGGLQDGPEVSDAMSVDSVAVPDSLLFIGGPSVWEMLWELEMVGKQRDGKVLPYKDLEYIPSDWDESGNVPGGNFGYDSLVTDGFDEAGQEENQKLARQTLYRWYRIKQPAHGALSIPGYGEINDIWQVLPLRASLLESLVRENGESEFKPPFVRGSWFDWEVDGENTPFDTLYDKEFSLNARDGIVVFNEFVYRENPDDDSLILPADLFLMCTFSIKHPETRAFLRGTAELSTGLNNGTGSFPFKQEHLFRTYQVRHSKNAESYSIDETTENAEDFENAADYYLEAELRKLVPSQGQDRVYAGFVPIDLDGLKAQVTYSLSGGVGTTRISLSTEHSMVVPHVNQRDRNRIVAQLADRANQTAAGQINSGDTGYSPAQPTGIKAID